MYLCVYVVWYVVCFVGGIDFILIMGGVMDMLLFLFGEGKDFNLL